MSDVLKSLSSDLAAVVETASASLVRIEARRRTPASGIAWSSDGVLVTSHHVVERDEGIRIGLPDGSTAEATLVGRDPTTDIAVLRTQASGLAAPHWLTLDEIKVGHLVLAVGRPSREPQATLGIVSALEESWRTAAGGVIDAYLQTDVIMYPGFSGGPLVGAGGGFAGMNTSALLRGVSVTLPAATIKRVVETLLAHGRVRRGFLGVSAQPARLPEALAQAIGQETGLLIASVEAVSPAEAGGLFLGDTLVALDGQPVRHMDDLMALLTGDRVGKSVTVAIVRGGEQIERTVVIGERA
ncbi:MAG: trypsin-like peptidase domain-containing protein [Anaerolineae bacterium]|nr:trypsin-like peptidase domain-containing protein [Anaerolineae bacterium]